MLHILATAAFPSLPAHEVLAPVYIIYSFFLLQRATRHALSAALICQACNLKRLFVTAVPNLPDISYQ